MTANNEDLEIWRRIHPKAMKLYKKYRFGFFKKMDNVSACRKMGYDICGPERKLNVDFLIRALVEEKGKYFLNLLLLKDPITLLSDEKVKDFFMNMDFCPQVVIGNIIENSFGYEPAIRYALALYKGEAD